MGYYVAWPAWSAYELQDAIKTRDLATLARKIDFHHFLAHPTVQKIRLGHKQRRWRHYLDNRRAAAASAGLAAISRGATLALTVPGSGHFMRCVRDPTSFAGSTVCSSSVLSALRLLNNFKSVFRRSSCVHLLCKHVLLLGLTRFAHLGR